MKQRFLFVILIIALIVIATISPVFAGSFTIDGDYTGDPTMAVVTISSPNCSSQGATQVRYDAYQFTVDASGMYDFSATRPAVSGTLTSIYLMNSSFNPAAALANCLAGDNTGNPTSFSFNLTAGTVYYFVVFDDTFTQTGTTYTASINGPGNITLLNPPTGSAPIFTVPRPASATIYNVPLGAPAYWGDDLGTRLLWDLPAGNWYIAQFSNGFAQVWIAGQANMIWIPETAVTR
ncbi:MAG: hypothetical protein IAE80_10600 [Anaerolinea sp.]|nr:hypothetical protein [Anaerolinea sp.]